MRLRYGIALMALVFLTGPSAEAQGFTAPPAVKDVENHFVALSEHIRPMVVNIDTRGTQAGGQGDEPFNDLFRFFGVPFGPERGPRTPRRLVMAQGSGFIYDKEGHIITNNHMVEDAQQIAVKLWNGKEYEAKVVGADPDTDVAVIKINPDMDLPAAMLGDSDQVKIGQFATAVGSPRGFEGSFAFGHVSGLGRSHLNLEGLRFQNFIQTDAAINLGNSGGPLCDVEGKVIGINVAIVYGANSLGFAIPINTAKQIVPTLISKGKVVRGFLGVGVTDVAPYAQALNIGDNKGAFVKTVSPDAPAATAGIQPYDVIREVNGKPIENASNLTEIISQMPPGAKVAVQLLREGKPVTVEATLGEYKEQQAKAERGEPGGGAAQEVMGLKVEDLTPDAIQQLGLKAGTTGVVVTGVGADGAAADAGIERGNVITEVAQQKVNNAADFQKLMSQHATPGKSVLLGFYRDGQHDITVLKVPQK